MAEWTGTSNIHHLFHSLYFSFVIIHAHKYCCRNFEHVVTSIYEIYLQTYQATTTSPTTKNHHCPAISQYIILLRSYRIFWCTRFGPLRFCTTTSSRFCTTLIRLHTYQPTTILIPPTTTNHHNLTISPHMSLNSSRILWCTRFSQLRFCMIQVRQRIYVLSSILLLASNKYFILFWHLQYNVGGNTIDLETRLIIVLVRIVSMSYPSCRARYCGCRLTNYIPFSYTSELYVTLSGIQYTESCFPTPSRTYFQSPFLRVLLQCTSAVVLTAVPSLTY